MSIDNVKIWKHKIHVNVLVHVWKDKILQHRKTNKLHVHENIWITLYMYNEISVNVRAHIHACISTCTYWSTIPSLVP